MTRFSGRALAPLALALALALPAGALADLAAPAASIDPEPVSPLATPGAAREAPRPLDAVSAHPDRSPLHAGDDFTIVVTLQVAKGWHINSVEPLDEFLIPTAVKLQMVQGMTFAPVLAPRHELRKFPFSEDRMAVYEGAVSFHVPTKLAADVKPGTLLVDGTVDYQACDDKQCLPPASETFKLALKVAAAEVASRTISGIAGARTPLDAAAAEPGFQTLDNAPAGTAAAAPGGWFARTIAKARAAKLEDVHARYGWLPTLALILGAGIALNLTPCIYPLIPITLGFFSMQSGGKKSRTLLLAGIYTLGMALVNSALGAAAGAFGGVVGGVLQYPAVLVGLAIVMIALALSLFGMWEIRMPQFLMRHGEAKSGAAGALGMGMIAGVIAAPCIGPFVASLLVFIASRQDALLGFALFFVLSLGLGLPFIVLSTSTAMLSRLPRAGGWMVVVRAFFGVAILFMAAYFVKPLLPLGVYLSLSLAILLGGALYLFAGAVRGAQPGWPRGLQVALGLLLAVAGGFRAYELGGLGRGGDAAHAAAEMAPYSDAALAAERGKRPVMIDFSAEWCIPCKQLEKNVFPAPAVRAAAGGVSMLKADLTLAKDPKVAALSRRYEVLGVPTLVFLDAAGNERKDLRHMGLLEPEELAGKLRALTGDTKLATK